MNYDYDDYVYDEYETQDYECQDNYDYKSNVSAGFEVFEPDIVIVD